MISRRTFAKAAAGAGVAVALPRSASAQSKELRILAYEGYLEPEWVTPFEERYGAKIQIAYTGSVDEAFARIQGSKGSDFDLTTFDYSSFPRYVEGRLIQPIDPAKFANYETR